MSSKPFSSSRWRGLRVAVAALAWCAGLVGCTSLLGLNADYQAAPCSSDSDCDDANACTQDRCEANGLCRHEAEPNASPTQIVGDCLRVECRDGVESLLSEPTDFPNDGNSCTEDGCGTDGMTATHAPLDDGATCLSGESTGTCRKGSCEVKCTADTAETACHDGNPCTDDSCNVALGLCAHALYDGVPLPAAEQTPGDCRQRRCQLGQELEVADDSDPPDDGNPCTLDSCVAGEPSHPPQPLDSPCSVDGNAQAQVCDGAGACVECNQAEQCSHLPSSDDCRSRSCTSGVCGETFVSDGTLVGAASQVVGDCKKVACDGKGGTTNVVDDSDVPIDGNDCTKDVCTNGAPSNPPEPADTACGAGGTLLCNGQSACVGCNNDTQCAADTFCLDHYCDSGSGTCKVAFTADGTPLPAVDQVAKDCKQKQCNGSGGIKTASLNSDVPVDGNPCTKDVCTNGVPSNPPESINTSCADKDDPTAKVCNALGKCVQCTNAATHCPAAPDCKSPTCAAGVCGLTNDADLSVCDSQVAGDCKTKLCDGLGGCTKSENANDVGSDGLACTSDSCSDGKNIYTAIGAGMTVAGACDAKNGCDLEPCACDGLGVATSCKSQLSAPCTQSSQCASAHCVDGVCCEEACNFPCAACSIAAGADADGLCQKGAITFGVDPGACAINVGCPVSPCACQPDGKCGTIGVEEP